MIHIVIPAAGNGSRFKDAGYELPKPEINVLGKPMIERVKENLRPYADHYFTVIRKEDLTKPTGGAVETILQAEIQDDEPLLIGNCDQLASFDVMDFINTELDGRILVFRSNKPHHSFVEVNDTGIITDIREKEVISNLAVTGIYYFRRGKDFKYAAKQVIDNNTRVKGEFYVSSVINQMLINQLNLGVYEAPTAILGTPEELQLFEMAVSVGKRL